MHTLFVGRWSPFHKGHKALIDDALGSGEQVVIAIRDTSISDQNPFTAEQRREMIEAVYRDDARVSVIVIPNIAKICVGRDVGYEVKRSNTEYVSGSLVRELLHAGKPINHLVPPEVSEILRRLDFV